MAVHWFASSTEGTGYSIGGKGLAKKKIIFHQNNAWLHTSVIAVVNIHELPFDLLPHPPYSPGLVPSDYHQFLRPNRPEVKAIVDAYFEELDRSEFYRDIGSSSLNI